MKLKQDIKKLNLFRERQIENDQLLKIPVQEIITM